jgi:hypothetical protein
MEDDPKAAVEGVDLAALGEVAEHADHPSASRLGNRLSVGDGPRRLRRGSPCPRAASPVVGFDLTTRRAGRAAQHAFWRQGGVARLSMLHQLAPQIR